MNAEHSRSVAFVLAIALLAGCAGAAKTEDKSGAALVGRWTAPDAKPGAGYTSLTLNPDGTASSSWRVMNDGKTSEKSETVTWHAKGEHLWMTETGNTQGAEFDYNIDGNTLTFGPKDGSMRYVMNRDGS